VSLSMCGAVTAADSLAAMRMRQSLAKLEQAFRSEAAESVARREQLRTRAAERARSRRLRRRQQQGTARFVLLALSIVATAVVVTIVMLQTLAALVA